MRLPACRVESASQGNNAAAQSAPDPIEVRASTIAVMATKLQSRLPLATRPARMTMTQILPGTYLPNCDMK